MKRHAFTMIELIFVIVVMGIIGKFGVEFLAQAYKSFIFSSVNHTLQSSSASTVEFIASRLQHRIKDSVIIRTGKTPVFTTLSDAKSNVNYKVLEWVGSDIDGFRATTKPYWSAIADLNVSTSTRIVSPETNTTAISKLIQRLSYKKSSINDAAIYFIGSATDRNGYGWSGGALTEQSTAVMHPIQSTANDTEFAPGTVSGITDDFLGVTMREYYKLSWTAYALSLEGYNPATKMGTLVFYYNYQPWHGERFSDSGKNIRHYTLMENVSTFRAIAIGDIIKIQVCTKSNLVEEYSLCKEKTIF